MDARHRGWHDGVVLGLKFLNAVMAGRVPAIHDLFAMEPDRRGYPPQGHDRGVLGLNFPKAVMAGRVPAIHDLFAMEPDRRGYPPQGRA